MSNVLTKQFRTKTMITARQNPKAANYWGVALDIGYSSVKGISQNKIFCFPYYAKKLDDEASLLGNADQNRILYKDESGLWCVGAFAQNLISVTDTDDSMGALFGRARYYSPMFKVISRTGLALAIRGNNFGSLSEGTPIMLQTGLPTAYESDVDDLKGALAGTHKFELKIGSGNWESYNIELPETNIDVMAQPVGTLRSLCLDKECRGVFQAQKYLKSSLLILDIGFGTLDTFVLMNGCCKKDEGETYPNLGMKQILSMTSDEIYNKYKTRIPVPAMQKNLESGEFTVKDRKERRTYTKGFDDILESCVEKVCNDALEQMSSTHNGLFEYDYLVVTGGTGEAWYDKIKEYFSNMETLTVLPGNLNDTSLPFMFANVRGYYLSLIANLRQRNKLATEQ